MTRMRYLDTIVISLRVSADLNMDIIGSIIQSQSYKLISSICFASSVLLRLIEVAATISSRLTLFHFPID